MKIDPKTFTLDALERSVLLRALNTHKDLVQRNMDRDKRSISAATDRVKDRIDAAEMELARIEDLTHAIG